MIVREHRVLGIVLFVAAIAAVPLVFWLACGIGKVEIFGLAGMSYLWIMLPFSVVPFASLGFGIWIFRKAKQAKKNIIAGSISAFFMIAVGLYSFAIQPDRSGAFLREASSVTGISFPENVQSASYSYYGGRVGNALILDKTERTVFEVTIEGDGRWLYELPPASKGVLPPSLVLSLTGFDYYCLFVKPLDSFNPTDFPPGEYSLTLLAYKCAKSQLSVFDRYSLIC